ncbi:MAG: AEC family transporter [Haloferacaceae archaeon]
MSLLSAFSSAILPILVVMSVGYVLARALDPDVEGLNAVALYAFLPALIFHSLATTDLGSGTLVKIFAAVGAFVFAMIVVAEVAGRLLGVEEPFRSADVLASAFPNAGFYGIPLAEFAFGPVGRTTAVLYITALAFLMYTVGVYIASRGGGTSGKSAVGEIFRLPLVYAIAAALAVRALGLVPPESGTLMTTVAMVGNASIPLMLVIVGIQLAGLDRALAPRVVAPTALKLVVAPLVGLAVALAVGFANADVARVFVLLCATPVALIPLSLTITYSDDPSRSGLAASEHLTTVIFVSTVASVPVLTLLIALLRSGAVL